MMRERCVVEGFGVAYRVEALLAMCRTPRLKAGAGQPVLLALDFHHFAAAFTGAPPQAPWLPPVLAGRHPRRAR